jgi:hypothetical protein
MKPGPEFFSDALARFDSIQGAVKDEREQCLKDRRFYSIAGAQWEGPLEDQFENKPRFEVNKIHLSVIRIINEYRNNRVTVDFVSKKGKNDKLSDLCDELYRADEYDSGADEAYDNAFEEAVGGGIGAWRLRAVYEDEMDADNEYQRINIEPIYDADSSVFFDLDAKKQDKSDAKFCFVISSMTQEAFTEAYPDQDPASWPKTIHDYEFDWFREDAVFVAEYYHIEETSVTVVTYKDLQGKEDKYQESELDEKTLQTLDATGSIEVRRRKVKTQRVHKYLLSGAGMLEDSGYIAGKYIPIIPIYGKRWYVDNKERAMGHVRLAKDSQRLKNMQISHLAEIAAFSSREKPIFTPEQINNHAVSWSEDNIKNFPYLTVDSILDANGNPMPSGPVAYTKVPQIPPAMAALMQTTEMDMSDVLGKPEAAEEMRSNISSETVEMIHGRLDMQTFIYMSNFSKGMKRCGKVWLEMAKDLYTQESRIMKRISESGSASQVEMMTPGIDAESKETIIENDLSDASMDVMSEVGPSSSTRRAATVRALTEMMGKIDDPEMRQALSLVAMQNIEGEGIKDLRDYARAKSIRMGVTQPTEEEKLELEQEAQNTQPDPQAQLMQSMAQEAESNAQKAQADVQKSLADTQLKQAQTDRTYAETGEKLQGMDMAVIEANQNRLDQIQERNQATATPQSSEQI